MEKMFDPHGWSYGTRRPFDVAFDTALEHLSNDVRLHLTAVLHRYGGKAFGLRLCELIAEHSESLTVPPWIGIQISEIMYQDLGLFIGCIPWLGEDNVVILRSSAHDEDWMSAASGLLRSPVVSRAKLRHNLIDSLSNRTPQIIQKYDPGVGVVVDICWSDLLSQPVVRIASGREYQTGTIRRFSSATSDHEGPILVLDLEGNVLLEPQRGDVLVDKPVVLPYTDIATELVRTISSTIGTKFGVQIELVVHPDTPTNLRLVQIRPTPGRVRVIEELPALNNAACIAQTAAVSGSFYHKGQARILDQTEHGWLMKAEMTGSGDPSVIEVGTAMFNGATILVWENPPHPDFGVYQMRMLHRLGVIGQITRNAITMNTTHGKVQLLVDEAAQTKDEVVHACSLLGLRETSHIRLLKLLCNGPQTLEIISDGLIGEIHITKSSDP